MVNKVDDDGDKGSSSPKDRVPVCQVDGANMGSGFGNGPLVTGAALLEERNDISFHRTEPNGW
jgi:hypothetical protein